MGRGGIQGQIGRSALGRRMGQLLCVSQGGKRGGAQAYLDLQIWYLVGLSETFHLMVSMK